MLSRVVLLALLAAGLSSHAFADEDPNALQATGWRPVWTAWAPREKVRAAFPKGVTATGTAALDCKAGPAGKLVDCVIAQEDPVGQGFGQAALSLVGYERIKTEDEKGVSVAGRPLRTWFTLLAPGDAEPDWLKRPTANDLAAVFPKKAIEAGMKGRATILCKVTVEGFLEACKVHDEKPTGYDFGAAALQLAPQLRMTPRIRGGRPVAGGDVTIPVIWPNVPRDLPTGPSLVMDLPWAQAPTQAEINAAWPKEAAGLASGQAALRCELEKTGVLRDCTVITESPRGKGFGKAAKTLSKSFRINFSPEEVRELKELAIDIPFRFRDPALPEGRKLTAPRWVQTLSADGMAAVYPAAAIKAGIKSGSGAASCVVTAEGRLSACRAVREAPAGLDFGAAAVKVASVMRMNPWTKEGDTVDGLVITLPIAFTWDDTAPAPPAAPK
ncbi:energy transducer TonB [Caulobacter sp. 1776]|uniref:energy transducer TonB n=1 Tax=Caulobacter sp. 1776 TaxID=3156420 RepID=UPI0033923FFF